MKSSSLANLTASAELAAFFAYHQSWYATSIEVNRNPSYYGSEPPKGRTQHRLSLNPYAGFFCFMSQSSIASTLVWYLAEIGTTTHGWSLRSHRGILSSNRDHKLA
jgi:hypothetical protein